MPRVYITRVRLREVSALRAISVSISFLHFLGSGMQFCTAERMILGWNMLLCSRKIWMTNLVSIIPLT